MSNWCFSSRSIFAAPSSESLRLSLKLDDSSNSSANAAVVEDRCVRLGLADDGGEPLHENVDDDLRVFLLVIVVIGIQLQALHALEAELAATSLILAPR